MSTSRNNKRTPRKNHLDFLVMRVDSHVFAVAVLAKPPTEDERYRDGLNCLTNWGIEHGQKASYSIWFAVDIPPNDAFDAVYEMTQAANDRWDYMEGNSASDPNLN
jgi:hypothetical protein